MTCTFLSMNNRACARIPGNGDSDFSSASSPSGAELGSLDGDTITHAWTLVASGRRGFAHALSRNCDCRRAAANL